MKKPMIGVVPLYDEKKESYWMLPGYMEGIEAAGGIPVMLPLTTNNEIINEIANTFDGFLFTGGHDVNPELYEETMESYCGEPCDDRDIMEAILFKEVLGLNKPAFGICRGLQLFNVLLGGTLHQDIPTQFHPAIEVAHKQHPPYDLPAHVVSIVKDSFLYDIIGSDTLMVNSYHHQGIKQLATPLQPVATAEDGMVEAVIMPGKKFVFAVQWHPEFNYTKEEASRQLFKSFTLACSSKEVLVKTAH
ncbi:gamma-glutamyl-gamma-aminobutyrate hydrolase family protein [Evansella sp. AB-rgal1]|uniref:gamma-glutamyl-gamma-aminobutyrate hydrolase family protein n=1 Tax=Evansella sp. AB-rgal1 TaxID=3242696 RepID=UPI00359D85AB